MKRSSHARFVGIGIQRPEIVDKHSVRGRVFYDPEVIAAQLRGEQITDGERYGVGKGKPKNTLAERRAGGPTSDGAA